MTKRDATILPGNLSSPEPIEWSEVHATIQAMIRAGKMEQAHLKLLSLVKVHYETAEYWLLLAWTAPDFQSAEAFFTRLVCRFPQHPKAAGEVPWSGKAWVQAEVIEEAAAVDPPQKAGQVQQNQAAPPKWETRPLTDEPPPEKELQPARPKWDTLPLKDTLPRKEEAPPAEEVTPQAAANQLAPAEQEAKPARLMWGSKPVSEREARWLKGIIPGSGAAGAGEENETFPARQTGEAAPPTNAGMEERRVEAEEAPPQPVVGEARDSGTVEDLTDWDRLAFDAGMMEGWWEAEPPPGAPVQEAGEPAAPEAQPEVAAQPASAGEHWLLDKIRRINFTSVLVAYMVGITLAEAMTSFSSPRLGMVMHGLLLLLILTHSALKDGSEEQRFLLALGMAPLIRLMSLSMPLLKFEFVYWYMIIGIPLLAAAWVVYRLSGYKAAQIGLGWGKMLLAQLVIGLSGLGLGLIEYLILKPEPLVESFSLRNIWLPAVILLVFTGFLEELIFRGLMQRASLNTLKKYGAVYISLLFAVLHIGYKSWVDLVFVFLVGFAFSIVVKHTRSLAGVTLAHGLTNISLFLVFPFLVNLQAVNILPPPVEPVTGPALWSGSTGVQPLPALRPRATATEMPWLPSPTATQVSSPLPELVVPGVASSTPTASLTPLPTPSYTATRVVRTPVTATSTPKATATATATPTATASPTATLVRSPTPTATLTLVPTDELPQEPTPTATITPIPTDVLPEEPTPTASATPAPAEPVVHR